MRMRYKNGNPKKSSQFICLRCMELNQLGSGIQRFGRQREKWHIKDLYCLTCGSVEKNLEVRWCDDVTEAFDVAIIARSEFYIENNTIRKAG